MWVMLSHYTDGKTEMPHFCITCLSPGVEARNPEANMKIHFPPRYLGSAGKGEKRQWDQERVLAGMGLQAGF